MPNYAKVVDGKVVNVIVAEAEFFDNFIDDSPGAWILATGRIGVGFQYTDGKFLPVKRFASWQLNAAGDDWEAPEKYPDDGESYTWDENVKNWVKQIF